MIPEAYKIVIILTFGFALASMLGYIAQRIKLSPIFGYLLAGYMIGPFSPGFVADMQIAEQLAEVGVMLMMFGVGLHFKWQELVNVKNIAIPGALGQTFVATLAAAIVVHSLGGSWGIGVMIGLAIGVASTVVLVRVLSDQNLLNTEQGHITVGWLIVEDILTVAVLILLPTIAALFAGGSISMTSILSTMIFLIFKFALLTAIMFTLGNTFVSYVLLKVAQTRSQELFTLTILALIFVIATGSAFIFGTSIALGAFIAGMVIGQTDVRHQASAYASPLKDTFVVIFFLSVGMLFNPSVIMSHFLLFISILMIILFIKPLTAFLIVVLMHYPVSVALTVALALAQIGEFSFILAEEAAKFNIFSEEGYDIIVACALISISLNPLLFKMLDYLKSCVSEKRSHQAQVNIKEKSEAEVRALVIGFGMIGQTVVNILEKRGVRPLIIDRKVETIAHLKKEKREAIFGEATYPNMLDLAQIKSAVLLVITIPDLSATLQIIKYAREFHPDIIIVARVCHAEDQHLLIAAGIKYICCDDDEVSHAFKRLLSQLEGVYKV
jgi:CPA2 family monovalent cation:H+ antiporter-2